VLLSALKLCSHSACELLDNIQACWSSGGVPTPIIVELAVCMNIYRHVVLGRSSRFDHGFEGRVEYAEFVLNEALEYLELVLHPES